MLKPATIAPRNTAVTTILSDLKVSSFNLASEQRVHFSTFHEKWTSWSSFLTLDDSQNIPMPPVKKIKLQII